VNRDNTMKPPIATGSPSCRVVPDNRVFQLEKTMRRIPRPALWETARRRSRYPSSLLGSDRCAGRGS